MMKLVPNAGNRFRLEVIVALVMFVAWPVALSAQWVSLPLPDTPRTADGAPDLTELIRERLSLYRTGRALEIP